MDSVAATASDRLVADLAAGRLPAARIFRPVPPVSGERPITVDQTNQSVVVGERLVVKWFRTPTAGHRAPELLARLAAAGFERTAAPYAAVFEQGALTALVTAYLPEAVDGWDWCVTAVLAGEPFAADLGDLAAELHNALAEPGTASGADWHARAVLAAGDAARLTPGEDGRWLEFRAGEIEAALRPLRGLGEVPVTTIHGDLHVGQVLRWRDGYAVIDFDGNPTLDEIGPQPAARDVAQLLTSLEHVAQIAIKRRGLPAEQAAAWVKGARADLLAAYTARVAPGLFDRGLLRAFEVEQECRELIYAARYLERWRYAPMGVLRRWLG